MSEFKREKRYIVIKTKGMPASVVDEVLHLLKSNGFGPNIVPECVVVERDWPIYEPVWGMVQRLAEGRANNRELATQASDIIDRVAAALWDARPHRMLELAGHPVDWASQPSSIKRDMRRMARVAISGMESRL